MGHGFIVAWVRSLQATLWWIGWTRMSGVRGVLRIWG